MCFFREDMSRQSIQRLCWLPTKGNYAPDPFFPIIVTRKGCFVDRLPEYRGLHGCRQFWVPGARCLSEGRADSEAALEGLIGTLCLFAPGAEMRALKCLCCDAFDGHSESAPRRVIRGSVLEMGDHG